MDEVADEALREHIAKREAELPEGGDWSSCLTHLRGFPGIAGVPPA